VKYFHLGEMQDPGTGAVEVCIRITASGVPWGLSSVKTSLDSEGRCFPGLGS